MKKTLICPKCEGRKLWRIERVLTAGMTALGKPAQLAVAVEHSVWRGPQPHGAFEVFICDGCGYTEWYAHSFAEIAPDPSRGIHLIDNEPKPEAEGPMR